MLRIAFASRACARTNANTGRSPLGWPAIGNRSGGGGKIMLPSQAWATYEACDFMLTDICNGRMELAPGVSDLSRIAHEMKNQSPVLSGLRGP